MENNGKGTLKAGSSPPRAGATTFKWLFLKNLRSKALGITLPQAGVLLWVQLLWKIFQQPYR